MVLVNIVIGNYLDDSTVNKIIVMKDEDEIIMNVEMVKANLSEDDIYISHQRLMFTDKDIYCFTEQDHNELRNELKSINLFI